MKIWENLKKSIAAGITIGIGATVYLSCSNKVVGAILFSVGLCTIAAFSLNLFTGKVGYVVESKSYIDCFFVWLGNLIGCTICALPIRIMKPAVAEAAAQLVKTKSDIPLLHIAGLSILCGILIYIAVENYKTQKDNFGKNLGILLAIPTFILCGFEHSIADMCYFMLGISKLDDVFSAVVFIIVCSIGNGIGSVFFRLITKNAENKS